MEIQELKDRVDTIFSVTCLAILTKERYIEILNNKDKFAIVFPGVEFENPKINFSIGGNEEIFSTTKNEIVNEHNHNLFKAWQIVLGISGMTAIMESYLKLIAEKVTGTECNGMGIFYKFSKKTKIELKDFENYAELYKYYQVRHITIHNLGSVDKKFIDKVKPEKAEEGAYVFYPIDLKKYSDLIIKLAEYVEAKK